MNKLDLQRLVKLEERVYQIAEEQCLKFVPIEFDIVPENKMLEINRNGAIWTMDDITLAEGGCIVTTNDGDLTLLPDGTGITIIGDADTTSHSLDSNNDLFVTGELEVLGDLFFDGVMQYPFKLETHTPSAANDTGVAGSISWDAAYIYICVGTDEWERVAIASW